MTTLSGLVTACFVGIASFAQAQPALRPNDLVRVDAGGGRWIEGTFVSADSAALVIVLERDVSTLSIPMSTIRRVHVRTAGPATLPVFLGGAGKGAIVGLAIGVPVTGWFCLVREPQGSYDLACISAGFSSALFTVATTISGGIIALLTDDGTWEPSPLPLRIGPELGSGRVGIRIMGAF